MNSTAPPSDGDQFSGEATSLRRLELRQVVLVEAGRDVPFHPGLNIIQGDITTGKTTFVRLLRALLGTMPDNLAPEVEYVSAIKGRVFLGDVLWSLYRPRTSTSNAIVEAVEDAYADGNEPAVLHLPMTGRGETYSTFLLKSLSMPIVSVPAARMRPTESLTPVSMTDWLNYCIVPGDEMDTQVFGHDHPFRDAKRRWVFQLAYGYYDPEVARLAAELRSVDLRLEATDREAVVREKFLADTPFSDRDELAAQLDERRRQLEAVRDERRHLSDDISRVAGTDELSELLIKERFKRADLSEQITFLRAQIADLGDLYRQLSSQYDRLTRAIVADEWLVDFDFVVCPRCGSDVNPGRVGSGLCYLCEQEPRPAPSREQMLAEQSRINSQMSETSSVIALRQRTLQEVEAEGRSVDEIISRLSIQLEDITSSFVSDSATALQQVSSRQTSIEADIRRLDEYKILLDRHRNLIEARNELEKYRTEVATAIERRELSQGVAEANVQALETRMLEYLRELHIPELGESLSVRINRTTYLPIVSGRTFDRLSSQGLKTLVNIAHALAHHTVAIDRDLPLPGLLVLDGLSANAGFEGFDQDRVNDVYRLLVRVADEYEGRLQIVAVDNELPGRMYLELSKYIILTLTQRDRLIRIPS